ncbi:TPA_asm: hypothetical protein GYW62_07830 [Listeria monocytogenes]|uniref:hypothetical protein n=1 Tax=Listeria monocytogenes TaxID=1639 RepID=UPI000D73C3A0|nr:hypothetical protein [Listeria monocytogenes]MBC2274935.1 hypothetical protein [Listeria welshimeri]EAC3694206.1 hypothetical protein [Listeria monocytogenes]EAD3741918.1 hypothetical protein [Listeria monocytogenes]EAD3777667.1 hypothetical protein [Listeria monocytogenes]EAH3781145.1 hypothetical protein [Listeria monocytogenes]
MKKYELKLGGRNSGKTVKINEETAKVKKDFISSTKAFLIIRGYTQEEIDQMVNALKKDDE